MKYSITLLVIHSLFPFFVYLFHYVSIVLQGYNLPTVDCQYYRIISCSYCETWFITTTSEENKKKIASVVAYKTHFTTVFVEVKTLCCYNWKWKQCCCCSFWDIVLCCYNYWEFFATVATEKQYFKLDVSSSLYTPLAMETQRLNNSSGHWYLLREVSPLMTALL